MFIVERLAGPRPRSENAAAKQPSTADSPKLQRMNAALSCTQGNLAELENLLETLDQLV